MLKAKTLIKYNTKPTTAKKNVEKSLDDDEDNDEPMNQINQIPLDFRPKSNIHTHTLTAQT